VIAVSVRGFFARWWVLLVFGAGVSDYTVRKQFEGINFLYAEEDFSKLGYEVVREMETK
jgi:hypothetical protein